MKPVWYLLCSIAVVGANSLVLSPIAGEVAQSFSGDSATDVLMASAYYGGSTAFSALFIAPHAEHLGLKKSLVYALLTLAMALIISALATNVPMLIFGQAIAGFAAGVALPSIYGLCADISPPGKTSETLGKVLTGWTLSLIIGVSLSAFVADHLNWRAVFAIMTVFTLVLALSLNQLDTPPATNHGERSSPFKAITIKGVLPLLTSVACFMIAFYGLYTFIGTHLTAKLHLTTSSAGLVALLYGVGFGAVAPLDRLIDHYGINRAAPRIFAFLIVVYLLLAYFTPLSTAILITCIIWGATNHLALNTMVTRLTALSQKHRAAILGLYSATAYASMFIGTAAYKPIFEQYGFQAIALMSAMFIVPPLLNALFNPVVERQTEPPT